MRYLLDTTVLIDHINGFPPGTGILARLFEQSAELFTCDVVACESLSRGDAEERRLVRSLLDALEYVATGPDAARWAGERRRECLAEGVRVGAAPGRDDQRPRLRLGAARRQQRRRQREQQHDE